MSSIIQSQNSRTKSWISRALHKIREEKKQTQVPRNERGWCDYYSDKKLFASFEDSLITHDRKRATDAHSVVSKHCNRYGNYYVLEVYIRATNSIEFIYQPYLCEEDDVLRISKKHAKEQILSRKISSDRSSRNLIRRDLEQ